MYNHLYDVIIILALIIGKEITTTEDCGTLSSSPVEEGQNGELEFIPHKEYSKHRREWLHNPRENEHVLLFDSANTTFKSDKYYEVPNNKGYLLIIQKATFENAEGIYAVRCQGDIYSNIVRLDVLNVESTTSIHYTHKGSTTHRKHVNGTNFTTSKPTSTTAVYFATTQRQEAIPSTHRSSSDGGEKYCVTRRQPLTTEVNIDVTNIHEEDDGEAIQQIPNQSTTQKDKEKISATEEEKSINTEELKLLIPITGSVVGIVVAVAVGIVCVTVRKKKRKEEKQIKTLTMESDDKDGSRPDGHFAEDVRSPSGVQEQAHPSSTDEKSDVAQANEPPEYASVIPKDKRVWEAKQNINNTGNSLTCDNKETENQLVYAELDLEPVSYNRPTTSGYEATEYVTIDFSRTGTLQAVTALPEQTETAEYVSVDFSKTAELQTTEDQGDVILIQHNF